MNDITKEYYNNIFNHKNNIPHAKQSEHIKRQKIVEKEHKCSKEENGIVYENTLPLINITYGTCPECNSHTYSYDEWRGEKVCPQCGLVFEEGIAQQPYHRESYRKPNTQFTWEEKYFLRKYQHHKYTSNTKEWQTNHNNKTISSLSCQAQLNKQQKFQTKYIIDTIGFKKLHSRANKPEIISAVIRYVLKQTYTTPSLLRYNQGIFKDFLTPEIYEVVEANIRKYQKDII